MRCRGMFLGFPRQACNDACGLAIEFTEKLVVEISNRTGAWDAMAGEIRHQVEVVGQVGRAQLLEQGKDVFAMAGGDKIICILDTRGDALQIDQRAERITPQPYRKLLLGNGSKDRHEREKR